MLYPYPLVSDAGAERSTSDHPLGCLVLVIKYLRALNVGPSTIVCFIDHQSTESESKRIFYVEGKIGQSRLRGVSQSRNSHFPISHPCLSPQCQFSSIHRTWSISSLTFVALVEEILSASTRGVQASTLVNVFTLWLLACSDPCVHIIFLSPAGAISALS